MAILRKSTKYTPQWLADRRLAHRLLQNVHETTPGGVRYEQFRPVRNPVKTVFALFPFIALLAIVIVAVAMRHP